MTRKDFVELAKKGWEKYDYIAGLYYDSCSFRRANVNTTACCAIGAAAAAMGKGVWDLFDALDDNVLTDYTDIMKISDDAGSKEAAIEALEAWVNG
jgi:hypothetical protein